MGNLGRIKGKINRNKREACLDCNRRFLPTNPCKKNLGLACKKLGGKIDPTKNEIYIGV